MNPRPPGYEPGELPGCSTPRRSTDSSTGRSAVTIRGVYDWAIWAALIAGGVALGIAIARLVAQISGTWRQFKRTRRHLVKELDRLTAGLETMTVKLAATETVTERLERSLARLQVSLARLQVLRNAIDEIDTALERRAWFVPRR